MRLALRGRGALIAFAIALAFQGCATRTVTETPTIEPTETQPAPEPVETAPVEEVQPVVEEPPPVETVEETVESVTEVFEVTEEVYTRTFDELEQRIREWNALIARKDYTGWFASLSAAYVEERGAPEYLAEVSRNQRLRDRGLVLKTLRDYFDAVVVPARVDAALDSIEFVGAFKVKAYAVIGGEHAILFYVVREDGSWKIGTSNEMALDRSLG